MRKRRGYLLMEVIIAVSVLMMSVLYIGNSIVSHRNIERLLDNKRDSRYQTERLLYGKENDPLKSDLNNIEFQLEEESVDVRIGDCNMKLKKYRVIVRSSEIGERIYYMVGSGEED